jgi:putative hydrolase of the HAD superfamily
MATVPARRSQPSGAASGAVHTATRAVLLDVLGTLLELLPPGEALQDELRREHGITISAERADAAFAEEIAYYQAHHCEGRDEPTLTDLRWRCLQALRRGLSGSEAAALDDEALGAAMRASLRFRAYPEVPTALAQMRASGLRLVAVSNWDISLAVALREAGLEGALDGSVCSALVGHAKPAREIFDAGLAIAGVGAAEAVHVGDSPAVDVCGAIGAGIAPVLLRRAGHGAGDGGPLGLPPGVPTAHSMTEAAAIVEGGVGGRSAGYPEPGGQR